ncbi:MAG TPA: carbohydate-binding domain-containing protein, partial [Anaerolineales bacterium]|nr:carbohydate-binding domain-containing protein [Anaerolineales bacterium]
MKNNTSLLFALSFIILISCKQESAFDSSNVELEWKFRGNELNGPPQFKATLILKNGSEGNLPPGGWKLYFSLRYHTVELRSETVDFEIVHESGELFSIRPTATFKGLSPGATAQIDFRGGRLIANYQDIPSGFFWVNDNDSDHAVAIEKPFVSDSTKQKLPKVDSEAIYASNASVTDIPIDKLPKVFPSPLTYEESSANFELNASTVIITDATFQGEAAYLANELAKVLGTKPPIAQDGSNAAAIRLRKKASAPEAYILTVKANEVVIEAG